MELQTLVKETTTTQGTGTLDLDGAVTDFRAFGDAFTGVTAGSGSAVVPYVIRAASVFEEGQGTFSITGGGQAQLSRDTVWASSNSDALVNLAVGTKSVYLTFPATQVLVKDATNVVGVAASVLTLMGAVDSLKINEASHGTGVIWHNARYNTATYTKATKGELNLPNGFALKWNTLSAVTAGGTSNDTFANAFPTAARGALVCYASTDTGIVDACAYSALSTTQITVTNGDGATQDITYVAWGD